MRYTAWQEVWTVRIKQDAPADLQPGHRLPRDVAAGIARLAEQEGRSAAAVTADLLRDALEERGLLAYENEPPEAPPAGALPVAVAADVLGVSRQRLYQFVAKNRIATVPAGKGAGFAKTAYVLREDLERLAGELGRTLDWSRAHGGDREDLEGDTEPAKKGR